MYCSWYSIPLSKLARARASARARLLLLTFGFISTSYCFISMSHLFAPPLGGLIWGGSILALLDLLVWTDTSHIMRLFGVRGGYGVR